MSWLDAFTEIFSVQTFLLIALGSFLGVIFGAIPGLTATMGVAIGLPFTFVMDPLTSIAFLTSIYIGGVSGGLIPAILLNIPGTPASIATTFDGYPMAQAGSARQALNIGVLYSTIGTVISVFVMVTFAPIIASLALNFGPFEYFAVTLLAVAMIASLSEGSLIKALLAGAGGIAISTVGADPIAGYPRYTGGIEMLKTGFDILPALIGIYAIGEVVGYALRSGDGLSVRVEKTKKNFGISCREFFKQLPNMFRSSAIGLGIGAMPGVGPATSNLLAYSAAKVSARKPAVQFGSGNIGGLVASETANNSAVGASMVPLLALGIPGEAVTALLLGAFMLHGLTPGPLLFQNDPNLVLGIFMAMLLSALVVFCIQFFASGFFARIIAIPKHFLLPIIVVMSFLGALGLNNRFSDIVAVLIFAVIGIALNLSKIPSAPFVLGLILGPILETNLRRGLAMSQGDFLAITDRPIAMIFLVTALIAVAVPILMSFLRVKKAKSL